MPKLHSIIRRRPPREPKIPPTTFAVGKALLLLEGEQLNFLS